MSYAFKDPARPVAKSVRRIARERLKASLAALADPSLPLPQLVHDLRKNVKRIRGLLRLVRPVFPDFSTENAALRDAARLLGNLRESDVLIETFDSLAPETDLPPGTLGALRERLLVARPSPADPAAILAAHGEAISAIQRRAADWAIGGDGFDTLSDGLEHSWRAARRAMNRAGNDPSAEALHFWRKRVKDHWYHATLLEPIWPAMMQPHIAVSGALGETLGDARDLAFLVRALEGQDTAAPLRALALEKEAQLRAAARTSGALLLSEPAESLSGRWRGWWKAGRRAGGANP